MVDTYLGTSTFTKFKHANRELPELYQEENRTFWQDVGSNYQLMYSPIISRAKEGSIFGFEDDPNFMVTRDMLTGDEPMDLIDDLLDAKSEKEFNYRKSIYTKMDSIRKDLSINNSIGAALFAGIFDPVNLIPIPTAVGMGLQKVQ